MKPSASPLRNILIVEDDIGQLHRYVKMARAAGLAAEGVESLVKAKSLLARSSYQYVLTDIHLNGPGRQDTFEGLEILRDVKINHPETTPLAMSADPQIETYHKAIKEGASYFFRKPILTEAELLIHLDVATQGRRTGSLARRRSGTLMLPPDLLTKCPDGLVLSPAIRNKVRKAALNDSIPIIIIGETGTGKEEVAKLVHRARVEAYGPVPFIAINCANLTGDAAISALFGHRKGAFTGAEQTTAGFIGEANGGFLFLDEIHTLTMDCQKRLLRVLNDGSYTRLGDTQTLYSDFQVIVASTKDLDDEVDRGTFLLDLRGRLTGIQVEIPPLRERLDDLPLLIELALARQGIRPEQEVLKNLVKRCTNYYWQGNVRQLNQVLNVLVTEALGDERDICVDDLPELKTMFAPGGSSTVSQRTSAPPPALGQSLISQADKLFREALVKDLPFYEVIESIEQAILQEAQKRHKSMREMSAALGVGRSTITQKLSKFSTPSAE